MDNLVAQKVKRLREQLVVNKLMAIIVPSNDPHFSEYVAERWKCREWISGFNGSAGTAVVTLDKAALWTDSRYFIQAEEQLKDSPFELKKINVAGTESVEEWLLKNLPHKARVAIDKSLFSITDFNRIKDAPAPITLIPCTDIFDSVWENRPSAPTQKAFTLPVSVTGESTSSKLHRLRAELNKQADCYFYPITLLDEIAWLFNLRGNDISYNPLAIAYAAVTPKEAFLFIGTDKLPSDDSDLLLKEGVSILPYNDIKKVLQANDKQRCCILNPKKISVKLYLMLEENGYDIMEEADVNGTITSFKSVKNNTELNGFRKAMVNDGVALVRFQKWLESEVKTGNVTELSATEYLHQCRRQSSDFVGDSFGCIMGYKEHGAIVHYSATEQSNVAIKPDGFLLFDSGGQYLSGTTDITRTIHLGTPTKEEAEDYTMVLKGMIALSRAKFPAGTRGAQLDVLARQYLWSKGKNYLHGTGHGVGHYLNVHEGPQSIRMEENPVTLKPGMVTSNEPGLYVEGRYGIRIENLILCKEEENLNGFLGFETLTLAPIDTKPICAELLTANEKEWLNSYHQHVFDKLSPHLDTNEREWLAGNTQPI